MSDNPETDDEENIPNTPSEPSESGQAHAPGSLHEGVESVVQAGDAALNAEVEELQTQAEEARQTAESAALPTPDGAIESAVSFNQAQLTAQTGEVLSALENPVADQAAVLMLEDLRGYMQGSEQLLLAASGQAMALLLDPATQNTGKEALTALATWQTSLITFSGGVTTTASTIKTDFSS